jgi:galactose mutarotase-like enzyme
MLHTIENEKLICIIESEGAEIRSLKDKKTKKEYIWQIDEQIWGSSSPILFPAIGKIKENKIVFNGREYAMPKHGIIRNNKHLSFKKRGGDKCIFTLKSTDETLKQYPFEFFFSVVYELLEKRLIMTYEIENKDVFDMLFACGGHTAYACNLNKGTKLSSYVVEFPPSFIPKARVVGDSGLLLASTRQIENNNGRITLSDTLFNEDALIFENIACDWIRLRKKNKAKGIVVHFKGFPHLALWSKPSADYLCIEPWLGLPDSESESVDLKQKPSYKTIEPGAKFSINIETEIE